MRKFSLLLLIVNCCLLAQSQLQIGLFGGISNYVGDLSDKAYKNSRGAFGLTGGYQITSRINLRAGLTFAKIVGADSLLKKQDLRIRNLSFQTNISELSLVAEVNTFDMNYKRWSPYIFGGLAVFHFNPYTYDKQNRKTYLQPLSTEGEGLPGYEKPYALIQLAIPFGGGIKYNISEHVRIGLEAGLRKTFTDHLDDVSGNYPDRNELLAAKGQEAVDLSYRGDEIAGVDPNFPQKGMTRGNPKYKDYYYFTGLHLVYQFGEGTGSNGGGTFGKRKGYGCPTVF